MQYGIVVAATSFVCYIIGGLTNNQVLAFALGIAVLASFVAVVRKVNGKTEVRWPNGGARASLSAALRSADDGREE